MPRLLPAPALAPQHHIAPLTVFARSFLPPSSCSGQARRASFNSNRTGNFQVPFFVPLRRVCFYEREFILDSLGGCTAVPQRCGRLCFDASWPEAFTTPTHCTRRLHVFLRDHTCFSMGHGFLRLQVARSSTRPQLRVSCCPFQHTPHGSFFRCWRFLCRTAQRFFATASAKIAVGTCE